MRPSENVHKPAYSTVLKALFKKVLALFKVESAYCAR